MRTRFSLTFNSLHWKLFRSYGCVWSACGSLMEMEMGEILLVGLDNSEEASESCARRDRDILVNYTTGKSVIPRILWVIRINLYLKANGKQWNHQNLLLSYKFHFSLERGLDDIFLQCYVCLLSSSLTSIYDYRLRALPHTEKSEKTRLELNHKTPSTTNDSWATWRQLATIVNGFLMTSLRAAIGKVENNSFCCGSHKYCTIWLSVGWA